MWDFAGNSALAARLKKAADTGSLAHCYIISGQEGTGRKTLARLIAAAMECTGQGAPCLECPQCRKVLRDIHPDVSYVYPEKDRVTIGVDPIRDMRAAAYVRPNEGSRRIFIIPNAQTLTEAAQNAMLKVLEEPPGTAAFFLLTDNSGSLLTTVRSRAVELPLSPVTAAEAEAYLTKKYPQKSKAEISKAASACGGIIGAAVQELENGQVSGEAVQKAAKLLAAFKTGRPLPVAEALTAMEKAKRPDFEAFLAASLSCFTEAAAKSEKNRKTYIQMADAINTAISYSRKNVGVAHICGYLSAVLTEAVTK